MTIEYVYFPIYGVEPYLDVAGAGSAQYGGGAKITGENLLISLWTVTALSGDDGFPTAGQLLRPAYADPTYIAALEPAAEAAGNFNTVTQGFRPFFNSRTSSKILVDNASSVLDFPLLAVLNPPGELKDHYMQTFKNAKLDPNTSSGISVYTGNSVQDNYVWGASFFTNGSQVITEAIGDTTFSSSRSDGALPMCMTSGADGVYPEFFDFHTMTAQQYLDTYVKSMQRGDFYVGVLINPADATNLGIEFGWKHSVARG